MQPYFFPYLGYFQLMAACDIFALYDDAQYIKGGFVNRNRIHPAGGNSWFTLPVKTASHKLAINQRHYEDYGKTGPQLSRLENCYGRAPHYDKVMALIDGVLRHPDRNVAKLNAFLLEEICTYLGWNRKFVDSSSIDCSPHHRGQDKVIALCKKLGADRYINAPGGRSLYDAAAFRAHGLELSFLEPSCPPYRQFGGDFIPNLSIIDVLMFNEADAVRAMIEGATLA